eukprot:gene4100-19854_t
MDDEPAVSGWLWRYSVVGRSDWRDKRWRRRWVSAGGAPGEGWLSWRRADGAPPGGVVELGVDPASLALYASERDLFLGVRAKEEAAADPVLFLFRAESAADHQRWAAALLASMREEGFRTIRRDFPTLDPRAL